MKRENAGSWNSGWKRSKYWRPILHSSKSPETPPKLFWEWIKNIQQKKHLRGPTPWPGGWGARPPLLGAPPVSWALVALRWPSSAIWSLSMGKKLRSHLLRRNSAATRRNLGGTNLGLWRSCSAGETSLPEGEISAIIITNGLLIGRGQSPSTSSSAPSHLKTLVHLLCSTFVPEL